MRLRSLLPLYLALLLALTGLGAVNQARFAREVELIDLKAELHLQITDLRAQAAAVQGPLAIGAWARARGMVPAPEAAQVRHVAPLEAPERTVTPTGLEMRTIWR